MDFEAPNIRHCDRAPKERYKEQPLRCPYLAATLDYRSTSARTSMGSEGRLITQINEVRNCVTKNDATTNIMRSMTEHGCLSNHQGYQSRMQYQPRPLTRQTLQMKCYIGTLDSAFN